MLLSILLACHRDPDVTAPTSWRWTDDQGRTVLHRGVNINQAAKDAAHGYSSGLTDEEWARLPASGFTIVRLLVFWEAIEPQPGVYDEDYLASVAADVDRAHTLGLDVLLDLHQDVWGAGFGFTGFPRWACSEDRYAAFVRNDASWALNYADPNVIACFDGFWASSDLQQSYANASAELIRAVDRPGVVGLDVINEPYLGSLDVGVHETEVLPAFYGRVGAAVRAEDPVLPLFVEPSVAADLTGRSTLDLAAIGDDHLVFAPHFYPAYTEAGIGFDGDFRDEAQTLAGFAAWADAAEVPLFLGEFGILGDDGSQAAYIRDAIASVTDDGGGFAFWSYDEGGNVLGADGSAGPAWTGFLDPWPVRIPGRFEGVDADGTARFALTGARSVVFSAPGGGSDCAADGADVLAVHRDGAFVTAELDGAGDVAILCR